MAQSLYIAGVEPRSGKSMVALGIMELLSRHVSKLGYFRPVVPSHKKRDNNLQLILKRYDIRIPYDQLYACSHNEARSMAAADALEAAGYEMVEASSAEEGLRLFKSDPPDLVIVDLMMEEVDSERFGIWRITTMLDDWA